MLALPLAHSATREVAEDWRLFFDYKGSIRIQGHTGPGLHPILDLNGHSFELESGGIETMPDTRDALINGGRITSSTSSVNIKFLTKQGHRYNYLHINSIITDSDHQVSLKVTGNSPEDSGLYLEGDQSNTFTGNVEISGRRKHLVLRKVNGAIAIRSDILVKEEAVLRFEKSNQVTENITTVLRSDGVFQYLADLDITNKLHNLSIEGTGSIEFNHREGNSQNSKYYIKLDEIMVSQGGHLRVQGWREGRDFLLVRKDSMHLKDALEKITIDGWGKNQVYLRDYDKDYYSIEAAPEPAACGVLLGTVGIGLWLRRRRKRRIGPCASREADWLAT